MHPMPRQFQRSQIMKKKWEIEDPVQGVEMNDPPQWDITNSRPRKDKYPWSWLPQCNSYSLSSPALSSEVCTFIVNKSLSLFCTCLALEFFLAQRQEPSHHCCGLSLPWTSLWASSSTVSMTSDSYECAVGATKAWQRQGDQRLRHITMKVWDTHQQAT